MLFGVYKARTSPFLQRQISFMPLPKSTDAAFIWSHVCESVVFSAHVIALLEVGNGTFCWSKTRDQTSRLVGMSKFLKGEVKGIVIGWLGLGE